MKTQIDRIVDQAWEDAQAQFIPVKLLKDDSSHWYIVPNEFVERFNGLLESTSWAEHDGRIHDYNKYESEFEEEFGKYRTGGNPNNYQLFISQDELKRLTGENTNQ